MFQIGALVQGRYRIQRPLGQGGMGTVFLARHERLDRLMAIKVMQNMAIDPGSTFAILPRGSDLSIFFAC
jgi:serine/threonine protein kinase